MSEPAQTATVQPQPKLKPSDLSRPQIFALIGERRYLFDKLGAEIDVLYQELQKRDSLGAATEQKLETPPSA